MQATTTNIFDQSKNIWILNNNLCDKLTKESLYFVAEPCKARNYTDIIVKANDIAIFQSPASQTMMDIYHQSNQTCTEFIASTSLCHLRRNNAEIFTSFEHYQSEFTSKVHAPLSQLLASKSTLFKGDANDIVLTLSQIYNALKFKKNAENTCLQIDARVNVDLCPCDSSNSDNDIDGDDLYDQMTRQFNFVSKNITAKRHNFDDEKCNNKDNEELCNINQVIRNMLAELPTDAYSYKRYEMSLDLNEKHLTTAAKTNKVPRFSFLNSGLRRIINSIKALTLTFSVHAMTDCIRMYCYVVSDGKIYGSRIFEKDLLSYGIIGSLFEDKIIDGHTTADVQQNMETKKHDDITHKAEEKSEGESMFNLENDLNTNQLPTDNDNKNNNNGNGNAVDIITKYCKYYYLVKAKIIDFKCFKNVIDSTCWDDIHVFSNKSYTKLTVLTMHKPDFISDIITCGSNDINLIPIVVFDEHNKSHIEYVWIVTISDSIDIGISLKYNSQNNNIKVVSIYLDRKQIQNQLVIPHHSFSCLDNFVSDIYTLIINDNVSCLAGWESDESYHSESTNSESDWEESDEKLNDQMKN